MILDIIKGLYVIFLCALVVDVAYANHPPMTLEAEAIGHAYACVRPSPNHATQQRMALLEQCCYQDQNLKTEHRPNIQCLDADIMQWMNDGWCEAIQEPCQ